MNDLIEFLRAQLDIDEAGLKTWLSNLPGDSGAADGVRQWLAEVDAKRRILELHHQTELESEPDHEPMGAGCSECGHFDWPCETIRLHALPYSDREGYRSEWVP